MDLKKLEERLLAPPPDLGALSPDEQLAFIKEKAAAGESIVTEAGLLERLRQAKSTGKPVRFKLGIDPTGPEIHLGHAIPLINLDRLRRMGHAVDFVIGDFTAMVGDPSGRLDERPPLSRADVERNMASYAAQASRVLDLKAAGVRLHHNSSWLGKLSLADWLKVTKGVGVSALLQREDFRKRLAAGQALSLAEAEYALLMGYDSVELRADVEVGGMDQFLNLHFCRNLMEAAGQRPEDIVCFELLPGTSGEKDEQGRLRKMSKSRGNYVAVDAAPEEKYGRVMSVPDEVMWVWYRELSEIRAAELADLKGQVGSGRLHPKEAKHLLARAVVARFHGADAKVVKQAEEHFSQKFGKAAVLVPEDARIVTLAPGAKASEVLRQATGESGAQLRRLVEQRGIHWLEGGGYAALPEAVLNGPAEILAERVVKVGKLRYFKFVRA